MIPLLLDIVIYLLHKVNKELNQKDRNVGDLIIENPQLKSEIQLNEERIRKLENYKKEYKL